METAVKFTDKFRSNRSLCECSKNLKSRFKLITDNHYSSDISGYIKMHMPAFEREGHSLLWSLKILILQET